MNKRIEEILARIEECYLDLREELTGQEKKRRERVERKRKPRTKPEPRAPRIPRVEPPRRESTVRVSLEGITKEYGFADGGVATDQFGLFTATTMMYNGQATVVVANAQDDVGRTLTTTIRASHGDLSVMRILNIQAGFCQVVEVKDVFYWKGAKSDLPGLSEAAYAESGLSKVQNRTVFGSSSANEGGGMLIYPGVRYWADRDELGRSYARKILIGYMHRCPIFRFAMQPQAYDGPFPRTVGLVNPTVPVDRTSTFAPEGYAELEPKSGLPPKLMKLGTYDALDGQHRGRMGHVAAELARQGDPLGLYALKALADHEAACWCYETGQGDAQLAQGSMNSNNLGCVDILKHWPKGEGCPLLGREFGHALTIMANAAKYLEDASQYRMWLKTMIDTVLHVFDWGAGTPFMLFAEHQLTGQESSEWKKKARTEKFGKNIPLDESPRIVKTFELGIVLFGMRAARSVSFRWSELDLATARLARTFDERRSQLWCIDNPDWNSTEQAYWVDTQLIDEPTADIIQRAKKLSPVDSGNDAAAFQGDWGDALLRQPEAK